MSVTTLHPAYNDRQDQWWRCRDALAGADAVKDDARRTVYLPRLSGQRAGLITDPTSGVSFYVDEYDNYVTRAVWYNASARTLQGLLGALFRKPVTYDVPEPIQAHLWDMTLTGESAYAFAQRAVGEMLSVGRVGIFVDWPAREDGRQLPSDRPYWVLYRTEQIRNWRVEALDGIPTLTLLVLEESAEVEGADEFEHDTETRYRVLELVEGRFQVRVFGPAGPKSDQFVEISQAVPQVRGQPLAAIPFVLFGPTQLGPMPEKPPLLDLIDINFSHYRTSADLEEGRHKLAMPTPWAAGFPVKDTNGNDVVLRLGSNVAYITDNPAARMGMLEFTGSGLSELRLAMQEKEAQMAAIGARLLETPKAGVEAAEAIRLRTAGEQNFLMTVAGTASAAFTRVLEHHARWLGIEASAVQATINDDFVETRLTPQERQVLMSEFQAGLISRSTYFYNLQRGEIYPDGRTLEEEQAEIEADRPLAGDVDLGDDESDETDDEEDAA